MRIACLERIADAVAFGAFIRELNKRPHGGRPGPGRYCVLLADFLERIDAHKPGETVLIIISTDEECAPGG